LTKTLTFLHTSPVHIATFDSLLAQIDPGIPVRHVVDESLLREAREAGMITARLRQRVGEAVLEAIAQDAAVVLCTCSTIGGCAEQAGSDSNSTVLRVDRPMAERAVALGSRIVIAAALASTLAPTRQLIMEAAARIGKRVQIAEVLCEPAWTKFEQGDHAGYANEIAAKLHEVAAEGNVVVLAQASMAAAAPLCADIGIPILSSPRLGLEAAIEAYSQHIRAEV
jgi:hypothetical protein